MKVTFESERNNDHWSVKNGDKWKKPVGKFLVTKKIPVEMTWNGRKVFTEKNVNPKFIKSLFSTNLKQVTCKISSKTVWTFSCPSKSADYPSILLTGNFTKMNCWHNTKERQPRQCKCKAYKKRKFKDIKVTTLHFFLQETVKCWWDSLFLFIEDFQPQNVLIFFLTQHKKSSLRLRISSVNLTKSLKQNFIFCAM